MATLILWLLLLLLLTYGQDPTSSPSPEPTTEPTAEPTLEPTLEPTSETTFETTFEPEELLLCYSSSSSNATLEQCSAFCSQTSTETISIGIKEAKCTEECITETIGCSVPWLCQILTDEYKANSCSTADLLFNIRQLDCDLFASTIHYTQYKLMQFCCNEDECTMDYNTECRHNEIYQEYSDNLYRCLYSKEAINNKWQKAVQCNATVDRNEYTQTCDYLLSQTYSKYGCECKSSFLIGHNMDNEHYMDIIGEWNTQQLESQIEALRLSGCASNVECVPNHENDDVFNGGLLLIEQILYTVKCEVFLPFHHLDVNESVVEFIESAIKHDAEKIYVSFSYDMDENTEGLHLQVLIVLLNVTERDVLYQEWTIYPSWFGEGSVIDSVESNNVNQTLQYYGAERYYQRPTRNEKATFIAVVVVAVVMGLVLLFVTCLCRKNDICKKS